MGYRESRPLSGEELEAIVAIWREMPGATAEDVADVASLRLRRGVSHTTARKYRPPDVPPPRSGRPSRPAASVLAERRKAVEVPASVPAEPYESPLAGWIDEARRVRRRLGIGVPVPREGVA